MLLHTRFVTFTASPRKFMPFAMEITAYVNAHCSLQFGLWSADYGYPIGTLAWSTRVESQAAWAAATAPLLADDTYLQMLDAAESMVTVPGQDSLYDPVYGTPGDPPPIGAVATATTAIAVVDRMADALGWAVEIAQHNESVMGSPISVYTQRFGQMGHITWLTGQPDLAGAETARARMAADTGSLARLAATKGLFIPGSGHVAQVTRIA